VSRTSVFTLSQQERDIALLASLSELTSSHQRRCPPYARLLSALGAPPDGGYGSVEELHWLPVRLFKQHSLKSIPDHEVFRVLTSSGTTGEPSTVYLDRQTAAAQAEALTRTLQAVLGRLRLPMLIADSSAVLARRASLSARGAAALGMMSHGRDHTFLLDADDKADLPAVNAFLRRHSGDPFLIFGFTHMIWTELAAIALQEKMDLSNGILLHTGGWKKLSDQAVSEAHFKRTLAETGLRQVHNYYGMTEAIGAIFVEGSKTPGLYCPDFADVIVRNPVDWSPSPVGVPGIIEVVSELPRSYPGHVLLTEDIGVIHGIDDGDWPGKRFSVLGRLPRSEPRGCSDAMPAP
jgi:hypothetical protein